MIIKYSRDIKENIIQDLIDIESKVYEEKYRGEYQSIKARYQKNNDTFVLAYDKERMIGYLCFIPISNILYNDLIGTNNFHDDDIKPEDITQYYDNVNLYIISIAILPSYQDTEVIREMTKAFFIFLKEKREQNICINNILASAVTVDGTKYLEKLRFKKVKKVKGEYTLFKLNYKEEWRNYENYTR